MGSQAILGQFPQAPNQLLVSIEADVFTLRDPGDSDLIFISGLLRHGLAEAQTIEERLVATSLDAERRAPCRARLRRLATTR